MLIDHLTELFMPRDLGFLFHLQIGSYEQDITLYFIGRALGRIAFPIFAFLIVQGFFHTRNVKKYILRLAIFALISEIPFDFAFWNFPNKELMFYRQNIFFTLLLGLIAITLLDLIEKNFKDQLLFKNLFMVAVIVAASLTLVIIRGSYLDYGYGVILIIGFYFGYYNKKMMMIIYILITGFLCGGVQFAAIFAAPFLYLYNGKKGYSCKYLFYLFYPIHLLILGWIHMAIQ